MRSRRSCGIEARELGISIWSRGRDMTFLRLPGSLNHISLMLQYLGRLLALYIDVKEIDVKQRT